MNVSLSRKWFSHAQSDVFLFKYMPFKIVDIYSSRKTWFYKEDDEALLYDFKDSQT